jgi:fatty-acyl-CoA synthase
VLTESYVKGPNTPAIRDITLGQLLKEAAEECPDRLALVSGTADTTTRRQWTYAELYADALTAARAILHIFKPGEHIAILAPNIPEWVLIEFASALAGTVLVTINPSYQSGEIAYALKQSRSVGVFVLPEFRGNQMLASVESIRSQCTDLREVVQFNQWDAFMELGRNSQIALPDVQPGDAVMIQYTSGTTGFPKGALLHHRGLVNNGAHIQDQMGVEEGTVWMSQMPMFHTSGCVGCVLGAVSKRSTQILVDMFEPGLVLALIEEYGVNGMICVPTMLVALLEHPDFFSRDISSIQWLTCGGSSVPASLVMRFKEELGAIVTIVFGQTEASPVTSMTRYDDTVDDNANTVGGPMPGVEVKIIDPETGNIVPPNTDGEYCARGYNIMHGYFDMPEATASTIDKDGWLHTGDLCSMDERGYCKVEGRLKDMIIRGGENIYPKEIEEHLFQHPTVGDVAVVGLPDDLMGEVVAAFIRPAPGLAVDKGQLFSYLREILSPQKTPKHWFCVESFPMTGSGKIQKFELRKQWENGELTDL